MAAWRTSDKCSVWSLLARLWRNEEQEMEVPRGSMNSLAATQQPLVGAEQNACGVPPIPSHCPSAAIIDVTENMRAKVYALCCKLGMLHSFGYTIKVLTVCVDSYRIQLPL